MAIKEVFKPTQPHLSVLFQVSLLLDLLSVWEWLWCLLKFTKALAAEGLFPKTHGFKAVPSGALTVVRHSQGFRGLCKTPGAGMGLAQHLLTQESSCPSLMPVLVIGL